MRPNDTCTSYKQNAELTHCFLSIFIFYSVRKSPSPPHLPSSYFFFKHLMTTSTSLSFFWFSPECNFFFSWSIVKGKGVGGRTYSIGIYKGGIFWIFLFYVHCFICRPSDFTVLEDAGIEPSSVTLWQEDVLTSRLDLIHSRLDLIHISARSHPQLG